MAWVEAVSPSFRARFDARATDDISAALERLERTRDRLGDFFPSTPGDVEVVFHPSPLGLDLARPSLPLARRLDAPAARRYRIGDAGRARIDVLAPKPLLARASRVPGSRELLELAPSALYARLALQELNAALAQAANPLRGRSGRGWAWLVEGAAAWLGGQTAHARPAVARRLREGPSPAFPPSRPDAWLLGGTLIDLLAREEGPGAVLALASSRLAGAPRDALAGAFGGRLSIHTEAAWRSHLERLAAAA